MRNKTNIRILVIGLLFCSSVFAKNYEFVGFYESGNKKDSLIINNKSISPVKLKIEKDKLLEVYDKSYIRLVLKYPDNCHIREERCVAKVVKFKGLLSGLEKVPNYIIK